VDDTNTFVVIGVGDAAEHHRSQTIWTDLDPGAAEGAVIHGCFISSVDVRAKRPVGLTM
jgi:hypothetical protein